MSLGIGAGDVIAVSTLAWNLYKACRDSSPEFQRLQSDIASFQAVLQEVTETENMKLKKDQRERLELLTDNCEKILLELKVKVDKYESMSTQQQRTWDRFRYGLEDVTTIRDRLTAHTTMLGAFVTSCQNASISRIQKKLEKYAREIRGGHRNHTIATSVATTDSVEEAWAELRRDLEDIGISKDVINDNREYITDWFKEAVENGLFNEALPSSDITLVGSDEAGRRDSGAVIVESTATTLVDKDKQPATATISAAWLNDTETGPDVGFPPNEELGIPDSMDDLPDLTPIKTNPRRPSRVGALIFKLLRNEQQIIEAASDGNTARVQRLIELGANVNAQDKWEWTALSMAAYGGYPDIAKLLIAAGAKIDHKNVDGDTPMALALERGHRHLVLLLEGESTRKDFEGIRELD